jgi:hypothetical protein
MNLHRRSFHCVVPLPLTWAHQNAWYRATPWPDAQFERLYGHEWLPVDPSDAVLVSAAQSCRDGEWQAYLRFVPDELRPRSTDSMLGRLNVLRALAQRSGALATLAGVPA